MINILAAVQNKKLQYTIEPESKRVSPIPFLSPALLG
jgi:hypothetical protein